MQLYGILWGSTGLCGMRSIGPYGVSVAFYGAVTELCWAATGLSGGSLGSYGALWQSFSSILHWLYALAVWGCGLKGEWVLLIAP